MGNPISESFSMDTGAADQAAAMLGGAGAGADSDQVGVDPAQQAGGSSGNPAWSEFLQAIPEEYHEKVTPVLQKWDQGVTNRFSQVQSQYAPWNDVINSGNSPDDVILGLNVLQTMVNNPRQVYDALAEQYKFDSQGQPTGVNPGNISGANGQGQNEPDLQTAYDQRIAAIESNFERVGQFLLQKQQAELEAQEDAALDAELQGLTKKFGDFDERYVLAQMDAGATGEQAVQMYHELVRRAQSQALPRPLLLGANSGGAPEQQLDPTKMSDQEAKNTAVQMVMAMNRQNQQ